MTTTTCRDCGGPLVQAFPTTTNYDRCRRCGHVFPIANPRCGRVGCPDDFPHQHIGQEVQ